MSIDKFPQKEYPRLPLGPDYGIGETLGKGKDNSVFKVSNNIKEIYRGLKKQKSPNQEEQIEKFIRNMKSHGSIKIDTAIKQEDLVLKTNHEQSDDLHNTIARTLYKKRKYELLKLFLADYIPNSHFLVADMSSASDNQSSIKEVTLQKFVPQLQLNQLCVIDILSEQINRNDFKLNSYLSMFDSELKEMNSKIKKEENKIKISSIKDLHNKIKSNNLNKENKSLLTKTFLKIIIENEPELLNQFFIDQPQLAENLIKLMIKIKNMSCLINTVNKFVKSDDAKIDCKLDLGGLSEFADLIDEKTLLEKYFKKDFHFIIDYLHKENFLNTPNILIDPNQMKLYCIDFDQGTWNEQKQKTLEMVYEVAQRYDHSKMIINMV